MGLRVPSSVRYGSVVSAISCTQMHSASCELMCGSTGMPKHWRCLVRHPPQGTRLAVNMVDALRARPRRIVELDRGFG